MPALRKQSGKGDECVMEWETDSVDQLEAVRETLVVERGRGCLAFIGFSDTPRILFPEDLDRDLEEDILLIPAVAGG